MELPESSPRKRTYSRMAEETSTEAEQQKAALAELSSLGRVSHRLAMVDTSERLQQVLEKLLPRLLKRIGDNHQEQLSLARHNSNEKPLRETHNKIQAKLVEMLSHTMKRVRDDHNCKLPCRDILSLLLVEAEERQENEMKNIPTANVSADPFTLNLSLAFLALGLPRCKTRKEIEELLPGLLVLMGQHSGLAAKRTAAKKSQSHQVAHLLLRAVEWLVRDENSLASTTKYGIKPPRKKGSMEEDTENINNDYMNLARQVLCRDSRAAAATFDLFIDSLLYQTVNGNVPPNGLSQAGHERLKAGTSSTARDWAAEKAPAMKLMEFKIAILDFIAPSRRWAIFMGKDAEKTSETSPSNYLGTARTVALLVVASGDLNVEVAQRANTYLKIHHDSFRGSKTDSTASSSSDDPPSLDPVSPASVGSTVGDAVSLATGLLSLALGQTNTESAISRIISSSTSTEDTDITWLGLPPDQADSSDSSQLLLSLKRRATSESTTAIIMNYVADKILDDNPQVLQLNNSTKVQLLITLPLFAAQRTLSSLRTASGLSVLQAKPYVAAAKLLNMLSVRVTAFFDSSSSDIDKNLVDLLTRALSTACTVLAPASANSGATTMSAVNSNDGSMAIRDFCYGVLCSLSRSRFSLLDEGYIFSRGNAEPRDAGSGGTFVSTETASLLFGCAANEVEHLRPRAVAALDALLGAYCRFYKKKYVQMTGPEHDTYTALNQGNAGDNSNMPANPWATIVSDAKSSSAGNGNNDGINPRLSEKGKSLTKVLLPLLWSASQTSRSKASRVAAARWASDLLKDLDVSNATHLLCFLAGDVDVTASSIAREGLGLPSKNEIASMDGDDYLADVSVGSNGDDEQRRPGFPDFGDFTAAIFPSQQDQHSSSTYWRSQYWDFSFAGKAATLRYGLACLFNDMYGAENDSVLVFVSALSDSLALFGSKAGGITRTTAVQGREAIELLEECARSFVAVMATSQFARSLMVGSAKLSLSHFDVEFLAQSANSSRARRNLSEACGHLYDDISLWSRKSGEDAHESFDFDHWLSSSQIHVTMEKCSSKLSNMQQNLSMVGDIHGAAFLGAQCVRAFRLLAAASSKKISMEDASADVKSCWQNSSNIIKALGSGTLISDEAIANACADALARAMSYKSADAPILYKQLYEGTAIALNQLAAALVKFSSSDHLDAPRVAKLSRAVGVCLASSTSGAGEVPLGPARLSSVEALFGLLGSPAFRKDEELALVAGEALASYANAYGDSTLWSFSVSEWPKEFDEKIADDMPPHQQILFILIRKIYASNSPHKRTACAAALLAIVGRAAYGVNRYADGYYSKRPLVVEIKRHMQEVQSLFISLLSDPKSRHLSRESCCLGLSACRGLTKAGAGDNFSTEELNHRLCSAFGQTTNHGQSAYQETPEQAAQRRAAERGSSGATIMEPFGEENFAEVGGASGVSESALNSYKEMAEAAVALGRIDILYALLILSVSHEAWFTPENKHRYSASALLGEDSIVGSHTNSAELRTALRPYLGKLLPRILRACHSPNKAARDQFNSLFLGLTGGGSESRAAITQHLLPTVDTLIEDCTNKLWRARVGACGALAEILVGRSWAELGGGPALLDDDDIHTKTSSANLNAGVRLLRLWRVTMRSLDDIRASVRERGDSLARALRSLSIRMCNPSLEDVANGNQQLSREEVKNHERDASAASATTLRWLIKNGLNQQCPESTGICLSTLIAIIDVVRPTILQPLIPDLLKSLLFSMSGLEPSALNYLQARSSNHAAESGLSYDTLERARIRLAQSGPIAAAVTKLLDMLPNVSIETQKEVIPRLDAALRESVGFASRSAVADAVSTMCTSCPKAFDFPGSSSTNPSVRLLRALYFASERERGQAARDKMVHALGNLSALCPGSSVRILAMKACDKYNASTGNNDDPASRRASASALRAIAVRASNQLHDGGPNDIWFRRVLPVAFLGKKDSDTKIASLWTEVWDEGSIAVNLSHASGEDSFGTIEEKLLMHLTHDCSAALDDVSWSRRVAGAAALADLCNAGVLSPAPRSLNSEKVSLRRAQRRAQASSAALKTCLRLLMRPRLWNGKSEVVQACVSIAVKWTSAVVDTKLDEAALFGWDRNDGKVCPWQPVLVSTNSQNTDDLFVGDKWFAGSNSADSVEEEETPKVTREVEEVEAAKDEAAKIDFEECDKLTDNEEDDRMSDVTQNELTDQTNSIITFTGMCRFFLSQALSSEVPKHHSDMEEFLPYRAAAFKGFRDLMASLKESEESAKQKQEVYRIVSPQLISLFDYESIFSSSKYIGKKVAKEMPPVLVARAIECLAASFWKDFGSKEEAEYIPTANVLDLATLMLAAGGEKQPAWTVREASWLCMSSICANCHASALRSHKLVSITVSCASLAQRDRKFWRVRFAGLKILDSLVARAGTRQINPDEQDRQLLLEATLPQKEDLLKLLRSSLSDSEAKITALSSEILGRMSWWP